MSKVRIAHPLRFLRAMLLLVLIALLLFFGIRTITRLTLRPAAAQPLKFYEGVFIELPEEPSEALRKIFFSRTPYPEEGVKGLYLSAYGVTSSQLEDALDIARRSRINAFVIDYKDDLGYIRMPVPTASEELQHSENATYDAELISRLKEEGIYLIARIVVFQDPFLSQEHPERAFRWGDGSLWRIGSMIYTNPFDKDNWDYNAQIAVEAAKAGFDEVQYDYVRFPESFDSYASSLNYSTGDYGKIEGFEQRNTQAITDFIAYTKEALRPYGIKLGVDLFGYIAFDETVSIGQNIESIAPHIDVLSAMIYPSHWGPGYFGLRAPDLEPTKVVRNYITKEKEIFARVSDPPISRPWLQAFTARYLGSGYYQEYGMEQISEQIRALEAEGIHEYLLWNAFNVYPDSSSY